MNIYQRINSGENIILQGFEAGEYEIAGHTIKVKPCGMLPLHFVSRNTGHKAVQGFKPDDFRLWYDDDADIIMPVISNTFTAQNVIPVLTSGNMNDACEWEKAFAVGEISLGRGKLFISMIDMQCTCNSNPVVRMSVNTLNLT